MKYKMIDDAIVEGETFTDIVRAMSRTKMLRPRSLEQYRHTTAQRITEIYGLKIDVQDDKSFVQSMVAAGLMKKTRAKS